MHEPWDKYENNHKPFLYRYIIHGLINTTAADFVPLMGLYNHRYNIYVYTDRTFCCFRCARRVFVTKVITRTR